MTRRSAGYVMARDLEPRDSIAPAVLSVSGGAGGAYSTAATSGVHHLSGTLNEPADWTVTVKRGDTEYASASGSGTSFAVDIEPTAGDGTYTYRVAATDDWQNGPSSTTGTFIIDTVAPDIGAVSPGADALPWFSPNGDASRETVAWTVSDTEAGSFGLRVVDADGVAVRKTRVPAVKGTTTVSWSGKDDDGDIVPDGTYEVTMQPRDAAGNDGDSVTRTVVVDATLKGVSSSKSIFYPQDGDTLARTTTLGFTLLDPATVTWTIIDADGDVVRTLLDGVERPAGSVSQGFNGRRADGTYLPTGAYRSVVTLAGDGAPTIAGSVPFTMQAFAITMSDTTPARGQTITVYATSAESLSTTPRVHVYQPGLSRWSVAMTKVSTGKYRAKVTLKSAGGKGQLRLRVHAEDSGAAGVGVTGPVGVVDRRVVDRRRAAALGVRQVPDDDGDVAQPLLGQRRGQVDERVLAGPGEGLAEHEVLGRIAGQGHLREDDEVRAGLGGLRRPRAHQLGVPGEVADPGVDLGQGHPQLHRLLIAHGAV